MPVNRRFMSAVNVAKRNNPGTLTKQKKNAFMAFFCWFEVDEEESAKSWFDYKRKAYGSIVVAKDDVVAERWRSNPVTYTGTARTGEDKHG